ncbi:hypothetical protein MTO96_050701, partial [Rhipicephalus appendiculatus]
SPRPATVAVTEGRTASVSLTFQPGKELHTEAALATTDSGATSASVTATQTAETSQVKEDGTGVILQATPTAETSQVKEEGTGVILQAEDWAMETSSGTAGKRSRDHVEDGSGAGDAGVGEPPSKALPTRRSALRPRPSIPPDRRPVASPPS